MEALRQHPNNARTADFRGEACAARFELKSAGRPHGATIPDGAFDAMLDRLETEGGGQHLALLRYGAETPAVRDLMIVASPFLAKDMIVGRSPLGPKARRAQWVG